MIKLNIIKNPRKLTPNQTKWVDRYTLKAEDDAEFLEPPEDYHEVCEWENGWIDYVVDEEIFWIWSMYSNKPDINLGYVEAFKIAVDLAKKHTCEYIEWDTSRPTKAWQRLAKNIGTIELVTRQLRIKI